MLRAAIYGLGRCGSRQVESVQGTSEKIRLVMVHIEGQHSGPTGYQLKAGNWQAARAETPWGRMAVRGVRALDCMTHIAGLGNRVLAFSTAASCLSNAFLITNEPQRKQVSEVVAAVESIREFRQVARQMFWAQGVIGPMDRIFDVARHGVDPDQRLAAGSAARAPLVSTA